MIVLAEVSQWIRGYDKQSNSQVLYLYITMQRVYVVILTQSTLWPLWNFADMEDLSSRPDFPAEITTAPVIERSVRDWISLGKAQSKTIQNHPQDPGWNPSLLHCFVQISGCCIWFAIFGRTAAEDHRWWPWRCTCLVGIWVHTLYIYIYIYIYYIYIQCIYIYIFIQYNIYIYIYIHICLSVCLSICLSIYLAI